MKENCGFLSPLALKNIASRLIARGRKKKKIRNSRDFEYFVRLCNEMKILLVADWNFDNFYLLLVSASTNILLAIAATN